MKLNLPDVSNIGSVSTINSNFAAIEQELQNKVLYRNNPNGEPNTLETSLDANGKEIYNVSTMRTTDLYIDGERVVPSGVVVVEGDTDISGLLVKTANLSDVQSAAASRNNLGLGNVNNTSDANKPISTNTASALAGKQATLVSGVNIKTINSNSILGSGDLVLTGVGETNTTSNIGTGQGLAAPKSGTNLPFKSLVAGTNVTLTPTADDITINAVVNTSSLLVRANNLSDVQSASTSRTNLGLGNVDNTSDASKPLSIATTSALAAKQATLVSGSNIKTINGSSVLGSGDLAIGGGNFTQAGTGAVTKTMQDKVRESISVRDFGAVGNGVADDTLACQRALDRVAAMGGGAVYFPAGDYKITGGGLTMQAFNITLFGDGEVSRIAGTGTLLTYPTTPYGPLGEVVVQNLYYLKFYQMGDGASVNMTGTWDSGGKVGPEISHCHFVNASPTTTAAIGIRMTGIWAANINNCFFIGLGAGGGPTTGIGGYGIRTVHGNNFNTSVMNVTITGCTFITVAFPMYFGPRTTVSGGRVEGIKITGNNMAAGWVGITTHQTLAVSIVGNQLSDYYNGIVGTGDFDMTITGNSEITGSYTGIALSPHVDGLCERVVISANNLSGAGGVGVRLSNTVSADWLRNVTITGNSFRGIPGSVIGKGIALEGSQPINAVMISSNAFHWLDTAMWFSGVGHVRGQIGQNTFTNTTTPITNLGNSGAYGTPLIAGGYAKAMAQAGADLSGTAPTITFPIPFKAGTTPAVFFTVAGTSNSTMEQPAISFVSNSQVQVQKKQWVSGSMTLTNYQIFWYAVGEAA